MSADQVIPLIDLPLAPLPRTFWFLLRGIPKAQKEYQA